MKSLNAESRFSNGKRNINVKVPVLSFKEDNTHIIFCPALDLSGSGNTQAEAKESFTIAVSEYLNYTTHKGTLWADLKKLGWTIQKNKKSQQLLLPCLSSWKAMMNSVASLIIIPIKNLTPASAFQLMHKG